MMRHPKLALVNFAGGKEGGRLGGYSCGGYSYSHGEHIHLPTGSNA
jgi:hypothetical protein